MKRRNFISAEVRVLRVFAYYQLIAFGQISRNMGQTERHPLMLLADTRHWPQ